MGKRIVLAGLAGGVLVFVAGGILHSSPKLSEIGARGIPNEEVVVSAMRNSIPDAGLYLFPEPKLASVPKEKRPAEQARYLAKFKQGPTGILVYKPGGEESNFGRLLVTQFLIGLVAAFIAAWTLGATAGATNYSTRVLIVALIGLFAEIAVVLPYWNWYGFPTNYAVGHLLGGVFTWAIAGLAMAAIVK